MQLLQMLLLVVLCTGIVISISDAQSCKCSDVQEQSSRKYSLNISMNTIGYDYPVLTDSGSFLLRELPHLRNYSSNFNITNGTTNSFSIPSDDDVGLLIIPGFSSSRRNFNGISLNMSVYQTKQADLKEELALVFLPQIQQTYNYSREVPLRHEDGSLVLFNSNNISSTNIHGTGTNVSVRIGEATMNNATSIVAITIAISPDASDLAKEYTVWIDYDRVDPHISVYVDDAGRPKPSNPMSVRNVSFSQDRSRFADWVQGGFFSSVGQLSQVHGLFITYDKQRSSRLKTILSSVLGSLGGTAVVAAAVAWYLNSKYRRWKKELDDLARSMERLPGVPIQVNFADIKKATSNFHPRMKLGSGAFGAVYKCSLRLPSGTLMEVAVKKFTRSDTRFYEDFLAEVSIINRLRHKNIVPLIGWSYNKGDPLLIYECMPNGSLDMHLFPRRSGRHQDSSICQWNTRYIIVCDIATGLHYVHHEYEPMVLHRDIKASNIMLDSAFHGRLGDFGIACTVEFDRNSVTGIAGTWGYIAPEYAVNCKATRQTDIYAFGVLVLEIVTGKKAIHNDVQQFDHITDWVWHLHRHGRILEAVDGAITRGHGNFDIDDAKRLLLLGLACSNPNPSDRPTMVEVLQVIAKSAPAPDVPLVKPSFLYYSRPVESLSESTDYVPTKSTLIISSFV